MTCYPALFLTYILKVYSTLYLTYVVTPYWHICIYIYIWHSIIRPIWHVIYCNSLYHVICYSIWHIISKHILTIYLTCSLNSGILAATYIYISIIYIESDSLPGVLSSILSDCLLRPRAQICIRKASGKEEERRRKEIVYLWSGATFWTMGIAKVFEGFRSFHLLLIISLRCGHHAPWITMTGIAFGGFQTPSELSLLNWPARVLTIPHMLSL
jgi:hypothetical protein